MKWYITHEYVVIMNIISKLNKIHLWNNLLSFRWVARSCWPIAVLEDCLRALHWRADWGGGWGPDYDYMRWPLMTCTLSEILIQTRPQTWGFCLPLNEPKRPCKASAWTMLHPGTYPPYWWHLTRPTSTCRRVHGENPGTDAPPAQHTHTKQNKTKRQSRQNQTTTTTKKGKCKKRK